MTTGIYKINFNNTDKVYIGQSINIEVREVSHKSKLRLGKAAPKLQEAYATYGIANFEILLECTLLELNSAEDEAIEIFNSVDNGFNTLKYSGPPLLYGDKAGTSTEDNEVYGWVLELLVHENPTYSKREISEMSGVSIYIVRHIAALESHSWLKVVYPELYSKLEVMKNKPYYYGKEYPLIKSPDGIVFRVEHMTNFAKEHNLLQPKLCELLKGTRNMHKGWTRH